MNVESLWEHQHARWRDPSHVVTLWEAVEDSRILEFRVEGAFWETLARTGGTLLVSREYEHCLLALHVDGDQPEITGIQIPHPSGIAYDPIQNLVCVACTRNPNQVMTFRPYGGTIKRLDMEQASLASNSRPLLPMRSVFYPGCMYIHDLAFIGGALHANSVGQNAVVRLYEDGRHERVWYPRCIEQDGIPIFGQNHIQLNSIAAGASLADSFYSASATEITELRPGDANYPVDKRGVIFSGATREPVVYGLTRPHSARLWQGALWVDNSGYGELIRVDDSGTPTVVTRLPGWTRGLCLRDNIAWVGTSRVIPRFQQYAPGLDVAQARCGIHAVDLPSGRIVGSLYWDYGNQIFALELLPSNVATGFPFAVYPARRDKKAESQLFYAYRLADVAEPLL